MMNPMDFLLWLSEEMETREWESKLVGTQLGLGLNFIFLIARANIGSSTSTDDVFSDDDGVGWLALCVSKGLLRFTWLSLSDSALIL